MQRIGEPEGRIKPRGTIKSERETNHAMNRTGWIVFAVALLVVALTSVEAQRGRGGGRRGSRGGEQFLRMRDQMEAIRAFPADALWAGLSFGIDLPDSQLVEIKPIIADAWSKRTVVLTVAKKQNSWDRAREVLEDLKENVDEKLKVHLTKDQRKKLRKLVKSSQDAVRFPRR